MRRLVVLGAGLLLVHTAGCHHVAGFCDCAPPTHPCCIYGLYPEGYASPGVVPAAAAAPAVGVPATSIPATVPVTPAPATTVPVTPAPTTNVPSVPATELPALGKDEPVKEKIGLPKEL